MPALGKAERWQAGKGSWLGRGHSAFGEARVEGGGDRSWSILRGRMRHPGSPSAEAAGLGLGTAGPEVPVPAGFSQPCSPAPSPRDPSQSGASLSGPVPFKVLELLPAVA